MSILENASRLLARLESDEGEWESYVGCVSAVLNLVRREVIANLGEDCETDRVLSAILADGGE